MYPNQATTYSATGVTAPDYVATPTLPATNAGWAAAALIFFWPLAFAAFNHSSRVYPLWASGDFAGAKYASDRAKSLGKISLLLWVVFFVLIVVFYGVVFALAFSMPSTHY
ncbi:CD225/dispanin family protein [Rhodococcus sp. NPDC058481]|uniref:CD225/dispanin family protein n=1 Tax=unclassified Rhodococcus (in: high G+C Gram-positive bacteria) TaxID=192944 RepID=UPI00365C8F35